MAVINFYDDIFDNVTETKEVSEGYELRELLEEHLSTLPDVKIVEVYNAETDETEYMTANLDSYKVVVIVNGVEGELTYITKEDDIIGLILIPQSSDESKTQWGNFLQVAGAVVVGVGLLVASVVTGGAVIGCALVLAGVVMQIGGKHLIDSVKEDQKENENSGKSTSLPFIDGANNQSQIGSRYLTVLGKHLISPRIVGTTYHETVVKNYGGALGLEDGGQWMKVLYCAGYGPLKLTNFKLGETLLAPNKSTANGQRETVIHGQLNTYDHEDDDGKFVPGDFTVKWKDNDVKMEILQAGKYTKNWPFSDVNNDIYGTIYPQSVHEVKMDATPLFIYDEELKKTGSVIYYNQSVPNGYRTNTVRFSASCPSKLEVELDFTNGIYAMHQKDSEVRYKNIPLNYAVQWRFVKDSNNASDAEKATDWENFDCMVFDGENIAPIEYTEAIRSAEIAANLGLSKGTKVEQNPYWLGHKVFNVSGFDYGNSSWATLSIDEAKDALLNGDIYYVKKTFQETVRKVISQSPYYAEDVVEDVERWVLEPKNSSVFRIIGSYNRFETTVASNLYSICVQKFMSSSEKTEYDKDHFNINEKRAVFRKTFTPSECAKMCNKGTDEKHYDYVEVRVIRITPSYIEQTGGSSSNGPYSYKDLGNWTYLRTFKFDKDKYSQAIKEKSESDIKKLKMDDYPSRPEPIESDLDDFVYIALSIKQDINNSAGSSLEKFSCIAESFAPKYSEEDDKWYPERIEESWKYYHRIEDDNGNVQKVECTEQEYLNGVKIDQSSWFKRRKGNDFVETIRSELFATGENIHSLSPLMRATLNSRLERKYITSNTASMMLLSMVGRHLGEDAKTYDAFNMPAMSDLYRFCNDVTDGTKEVYTYLPKTLRTNVSLTMPERIVYPDQMRKKGWPESEIGDYSTILTQTYYDDVNNKAVVFSPIHENGVIDSYTITQDMLEGGVSIPDYMIMATFEGSNCLQMSDYYAAAAHQVGALYYEGGKIGGLTSNVPEITEEGYRILRKLMKYPINAINRGICKNLIYRLIELGEAYDGHDNPDYALYDYYLIVLAQTLNSPSSTHVALCKDSDNQLHIQFNCNAVLDRDIKVEALMQRILLTGRSYLQRSEDNKYEPIIGRPAEYPVALLDQRNVLSRSNSKNLEELPCGFQMSLIDEEDNYSTNDIYVMDDGESYADPTARIEQLSIDYVTDKYQLASLGKFNLAARLYQLESYTRTVGSIGHSLSVGDMVLLQDDSLSIGLGNSGRIIELIEDENLIYGFTTDEPVEYKDSYKGESGDFGCTIMQPQANGPARCVTLAMRKSGSPVVVNDCEYRMKEGLTNLFLFDIPVSKTGDITETPSDYYCVQPKMDNLVAFGLVEKITIKAIIMSVKPKALNKFDLVLVPYTPGLYEAGNEMPVFEASITSAEKESFSFNTTVTHEQLVDALTEMKVQEIQPVMSKVDSLYSNHIITLYRELKEGETAITSTGIDFDVTYNFSDNTIAEISQLNQLGWKLQYPESPERDVYVTSATAFGKALTDVVEPNEWAKPVSYGKDGKDGISVATIALYKRGLNAPAKPTGKAKYCFDDAKILWSPSGSNNGWTTDVPKLNEDNWPIWRISATALTTKSSSTKEEGKLYDTIDVDEWSEQEQYTSSDVWSKSEIQQYVKNQIADTSTPVLTSSVTQIGFATNDDGYVPIEQTSRMKIGVTQFNTSLGFTMKPLPSVNGLALSWDENTKELTVKAVAAKRLGNTAFKITVTCVPIKEDWTTGDPNNYRFVSTEYVKLLSKPVDWSSKYYKYYYNDNGSMVQNESAEWDDNKTYYELYLNGIYGDEGGTSTIELSLDIGVSTVVGGRKLDDVSSLDELKTKTDEWKQSDKGLYIGDYFLWKGTTTDSDLASDGKFIQFNNYCYRGTDTAPWVKDREKSHMAMAIDEILSSASEELDLAELNPDAYNYMKELLASKISVRTLIAEESFINNLFAKHIIVGGQEKKEGDICGYYLENNIEKLGFKLGSDGKFYAQNAEIEGTIKATSLTIGPKQQSASEYVSEQVDKTVVEKNKGTWVSSTTYQVGDIVYYETTGSSYVCIKTPTTAAENIPTSNCWNLYAGGGYQDYKFAIGAFGLTDAQLRALTWSDSPPAVTTSKPCLYMATKWVKG